MGVDELIGAIGLEAARQREAILDAAKREAEEVFREAQGEARRLLAEAPARGEAAARAEAARAVSGARLAARREVLAARQGVVEEAFRILREHLRALPGTPAGDAVLAALLRECAAGAAGPLAVRCRAADRPAVARHAAGLGLEAALEDADLPLGGLETVEGGDRRVVCRNGLADRLEAARPRLLEEASRALFGAGDDGPPGQGAAA